MTSPKPQRSLAHWFWDVWCGTATTFNVFFVVTAVATGLGQGPTHQRNSCACSLCAAGFA